MSFQRYPTYKDSGVEWLGEVPQHWNVWPLKRELERNDGGVWGDEPDGDGDTIVLRSTEQTVDGQWQLDDPARRKLSESDIDAALLLAGDLVLTKSSGSALHIGKTSLVSAKIAETQCCHSNFMQRLRMRRSYSPKLAWYVLNSEVARRQFDMLSNSTTGLANLSAAVIGRLLVPVPPATEQEAIASFLDRETTRIDMLVAEQRRLMELLKEKRQAVISNAVTKGLNPHTPTKDSGIEWLGDVPEHWDVVRLGNVYRETSAPGRDDLPILSVSIHHGVSDTEVAEDELERKVLRIEDRSKYVRVAKNDLVYNMMRAWQGAFGTVEVDGMVSPAYVVARPRRPIVTAFVENLLRTPQAIEQMRRYSQGVTDFRLRLYWDEFKNIRVVLPPNDEARAIRADIAATEENFERMTQECERLISLLTERRAALVSAAVTGRIDVRHLDGGSTPPS